MYEIGDLLSLSNNKKYIVVNKIVIDNNEYLYLISQDGIKEIKICRVYNNLLKVVTDQSLLKSLIEKFQNM